MSLTKYSDVDFSSRYSGKFGGCSSISSGDFTSVQEAILGYSTSLHAYSTKLDSEFALFEDSMADIKTAHDGLADTVKSMANNMALFKIDIQDFLSTISGDTGLISRLNCKFLSDNLNRVQKSLCFSFVPALF